MVDWWSFFLGVAVTYIGSLMIAIFVAKAFLRGPRKKNGVSDMDWLLMAVILLASLVTILRLFHS